MTQAISELEPRALWARFDDLRRIPRPSFEEERVRRFVLDFAAAHGCATETDAAGNAVVRVPATPGHEAAPTVVLQGHLDMVCEKNADKEFDFRRDPIQLRLEGDLLRADGTTLGADNGVAVAAGLALITDAPRPHGPLELLFTVAEEVGLKGAQQLDPSLVRGRLLLNLDSELEGVITIGCAGSRSVQIVMPCRRGAVPDLPAFRITASGGRGGHSGVDIHLGRANALRVLVDLLQRLEGGALVSLEGGNAGNAIPREAQAVVYASAAALERALQATADECRRTFAASDPALRLEHQPLASAGAPLDAATTRELLALLADLPVGALAMSPELPDLVQTSNNLATVRCDETEIRILCSTRSSVQAELDATVERILALAEGHGARAEADRGYPGWQPDPESSLLATAVAVHRRLFGGEPEITAIHAGLECGLIGHKIPGMDMISIGPTIRNPHSPFEEVSVSSVKTVLGDYLNALLEELSAPS